MRVYVCAGVCVCVIVCVCVCVCVFICVCDLNLFLSLFCSECPKFLGARLLLLTAARNRYGPQISYGRADEGQVVQEDEERIERGSFGRRSCRRLRTSEEP